MEGEQVLRVAVWAKEGREDDLLGEGEVKLGEWPDHEFDGSILFRCTSVRED